LELTDIAASIALMSLNFQLSPFMAARSSFMPSPMPLASLL
jgi:hypothetical protein